ncbi:YbjN domain-containing protein [Hyphococcus flavus]|uniref:YbjN domain-containing protein n=1 Tax=Hyphococcus flavus TaxID=1866326 RepID=A0AAE9ZLB2_9PROT|nr:YbjN domain-containing protein [Hyphococcus flavus]WDI33231.1 YbjN domain-containing protein [Hyphococcus flavus]
MKPVSLFIGAAALALVGSVSAANAQNQMGSSSGSGISNPTNVVKNFSVQTVGPVLNELGVSWSVERLDNGAQYIIAAAGSMPFLIQFNACPEGQSGCAGLLTTALFDVATPNAQTVQAFNARAPFVTAGVEQGVTYISRYDIADYGIPRGNIASSIANFLWNADAFAQELAQSHQTVSLDGYASDLSAKHLNRQAVENMTGVAAKPSTPVEYHQFGLDEKIQMIRLYVQDTSVPKTKIDNVD